MHCGRPDTPLGLRLTDRQRQELLSASRVWARTEWTNKPAEAHIVNGHEFICPICLEPLVILRWIEAHATRVFAGCPTCNLATGDVYTLDPRLKIDQTAQQKRYLVWTYQRYQELIGHILRDIPDFVRQRNEWIAQQNAVLEHNHQPGL